MAAYRLRQTEPQAMRAVARFLSRTRQPDALEIWAQLAKIEKLTPEDLRDEATIAMMANEIARAEAAVRELLARADVGPADWLLAAQLLINKGAPAEAQTFLDRILVDSRATPREQLQAAVLELASARSGSSTPNERETAAWSRLEKLSADQSAVGLDVLVVLAQRALSSQTGGTTSVSSDQKDTTARVPPIVDLANALEKHPLAKAQHKLLALDLRIHADESQRDALVARAIKDWKNSEAGGLAALAAWLNGKGEYQKTLDTIPLEKALQSRDLFLQHLDALGALDRWSEVKQLLSSDRFPLEPVVQQMYLARCSAQLGEKTATQNYWQRALEAAGGDLQKLFTLAEYAQKNGNAEIAEAAYNSAAAAAPKLRIAQDGRLRLAHAKGDTKKMHTVLADMLRIWPDDPAIQNDEAYTRLLVWPADAAASKHEAAQVEQLAEKLIEREPASLPHRTLLALARLRQGRAQDALRIYENVQVAVNILTPSALAVHAAVLEATGHHEDALTEKGQIKPEQLLPEERALIEKIL